MKQYVTNAHAIDSKNGICMMSQFYDGEWLSEYALDCGYIETFEEEGQWIRMWKEGCFHVRHHNFTDRERVSWESYDTIGEARKALDKAINTYKEKS